MSNTLLIIGGIVIGGFTVCHILNESKNNKTKVNPKTIDCDRQERNTLHRSFNLVYLSDLAKEYKVELNTLEDFRYLLERIEVVNQVHITEKFKENSGSVEKLIHLWDTYKAPFFTLKTNLVNSGNRNINEEDINLIFESRGLIATNKTIEEKIEELVNSSYQKGYSNFKRLFGEKIEKLKKQYLTNSINHYLLESIQEDLNNFLKFIS